LLYSFENSCLSEKSVTLWEVRSSVYCFCSVKHSQHLAYNNPSIYALNCLEGLQDEAPQQKEHSLTELLIMNMHWILRMMQKQFFSVSSFWMSHLTYSWIRWMFKKSILSPNVLPPLPLLSLLVPISSVLPLCIVIKTMNYYLRLL
jgi:hypothetical protein